MLLATVVLVLFASASAFFAGPLSGRSTVSSLMMIQHSPQVSTRSVPQECGKDSSPALHLANRLFHLTEMINEDEVIESLVRMCPNGEISFTSLDASSDFKSMKGTWSRSETTLSMVIERTLMVRTPRHTNPPRRAFANQ
jgi:hypothetical protein